MSSPVSDLAFVNMNRQLKIVHTANHDVCSVYHPLAKYGAFTTQGECEGVYTHQVCRDPNCNMNSDHYDHDQEIHYYHLCWNHTPNDSSNGECDTKCPFRSLITVIIDNELQK